MASHFVPFRKQIAGQDFAVTEFTNRAQMRRIRRCTIDGKPVSKPAFDAALKAAEGANASRSA